MPRRGSSSSSFWRCLAHRAGSGRRLGLHRWKRDPPVHPRTGLRAAQGGSCVRSGRLPDARPRSRRTKESTGSARTPGSTTSWVPGRTAKAPASTRSTTTTRRRRRGEGPTAAADAVRRPHERDGAGQEGCRRQGRGMGSAFPGRHVRPVPRRRRHTATPSRRSTPGRADRPPRRSTLAADLTGPVDLCYGCGIKDWSWFGADNFKTELGRFLGIATPVTTGERPATAISTGSIPGTSTATGRRR